MAGLGHWYIEIKKQGWWRGANHVWDNRYVLSGSDPNSEDAANCIDAIHTIEDHLFPAIGSGLGVGFVEGKAYGSGGGVPIVETPWNSSETPDTATGFSGPSGGYNTLAVYGPLEICLDVRSECQTVSKTGKPVYIRKFYRGMALVNDDDETAGDTELDSGDVATIKTTLAPLTTGLSTGGWTVIAPSGRVPASGFTAQLYLGSHQVPRGRKRTSTKAATSATSTLWNIIEHIGEAGAGAGIGELLGDL